MCSTPPPLPLLGRFSLRGSNPALRSKSTITRKLNDANTRSVSDRGCARHKEYLLLAAMVCNTEEWLDEQSRLVTLVSMQLHPHRLLLHRYSPTRTIYLRMNGFLSAIPAFAFNLKHSGIHTIHHRISPSSRVSCFANGYVRRY